MNAIKSPLGETRGCPIQPPVSYNGFPMGNSRRFRPPKSRTTARVFPSADQSAHCTCSNTSRGAPPTSGARASVPMLTHVPKALLFSKTAISDADDTDMSWV